MGRRHAGGGATGVRSPPRSWPAAGRPAADGLLQLLHRVGVLDASAMGSALRCLTSGAGCGGEVRHARHYAALVHDYRDTRYTSDWFECITLSSSIALVLENSF